MGPRLIVAILLIAYSCTSRAGATELEKMKNEMLDPVVRVADKEDQQVGAGFVLLSDCKQAGCTILIATALHVIQDADDNVRTDAFATFYDNPEILPLTVVRVDKERDVALLQTQSLKQHIAARWSYQLPPLQPLQTVWGIGCGARLPPFPVVGTVSLAELAGKVVSSQFTVPGDSGGPLFVEYGGHYYVAGMVQMIKIWPRTQLVFGRLPVRDNFLLTGISISLPVSDIRQVYLDAANASANNVK